MKCPVCGGELVDAWRWGNTCIEASNKVVCRDCYKVYSDNILKREPYQITELNKKEFNTPRFPPKPRVENWAGRHNAEMRRAEFVNLFLLIISLLLIIVGYLYASNQNKHLFGWQLEEEINEGL